MKVLKNISLKEWQKKSNCRNCMWCDKDKLETGEPCCDYLGQIEVNKQGFCTMNTNKGSVRDELGDNVNKSGDDDPHSNYTLEGVDKVRNVGPEYAELGTLNRDSIITETEKAILVEICPGVTSSHCYEKWIPKSLMVLKVESNDICRDTFYVKKWFAKQNNLT